MATFVSDAAILEEVAAIHRTTAAAAPDSWTPIIAKANDRAYRYILHTLQVNGLSRAQILAWDDGEDWNRELALCNALRKIGLPEGQEGISLSKICEAKEELKKISTIIVSGAMVRSSRGSVSTGVYNTTDDIFTMESEL